MQYTVNQTILQGLFGRHKKVTVRITGDLFYIFSCVIGQYCVYFFPDAQDLPGMNFYIRCRPLSSSQRLVNHYP